MIMRIFTRLYSKYLGILDKIYRLYISRKKGIYINDKVNIKGYPIIDIRNSAKLIIENNVTLTSRNRGYHINLHSPVKLMAIKEGALIHIGENTRIHGTCIHANKSIRIGSNCLIAANCQIMDNNAHDLSFSNVENRINTKGVAKPIIIEDNVWIGANSIILPGVTIGKGSIISANSVVVRDIPSMVIAGGNPAIVIKNYNVKKGK